MNPSIKIDAMDLIVSRARMKPKDLGKLVFNVFDKIKDRKFSPKDYPSFIVGYRYGSDRDYISRYIRRDVLKIGFCAVCGSDKNLEVDHIFPISKGGGSDRENLQTLCRRCNRFKSNKTP